MKEPLSIHTASMFTRLRQSVHVPPTLIYFASIVFLFSLADAIFAYYIPVYIEAHVSGPLILGIILSVNSVVGLLADIVIGEWLQNRKFSFFLRWTFIFSITYPTALLLLPAAPIVLIGAVGIWGIYYELISFAQYQFVHTYTGRNQHAQAWGLLSVFHAIAHTIGPVLSSNLIHQERHAPFVVTIIIVLLGAIAMSILYRTKKRKRPPTVMVARPSRPKSFAHELKVWRILYPRMWHLLLFMASLAIVDNNFWTIGTILSEELPREYDSGLLIVLYTVPSLFMGLVAGGIATVQGKKRAAFICGLVAGVILTYAGLTPSIPALMLSVFCAAIFLAIAWPEVHAVMADFVSRLGHNSNELIAMNNSHLNLAYIVGPIFSGFLATVLGNQASFSAVGVLLAAVSIFALLSVPRKIKLPQTLLESVN